MHERHSAGRDRAAVTEAARLEKELDALVSLCAVGEAIGHLRERGADLVLCDIGLPGVSGHSRRVHWR